MKKYFSFLLIVFLVFGCSSKDFVRYSEKEYAPSSKCILIEDLEKSEYKYEIFGEIMKKTNAILAKPQESFKDIFEEAMNYGADAITGIKADIFTVRKQTIKYPESDMVSIKLIRYVRDKNGNPVKR